MRIFVDIGGFRGHSTLAALDPIFGFEKVFCFEPVPSLADGIKQRIQSQKVTVICGALADRDGTSNLYHAGSLAGSLFSDSPEYGESIGTIEIRLIKASDFFAEHIHEADFVRVKFNCEGAEAIILRDLIDHGHVKCLDGALVDFDAEKIGSIRGAADKLRTVLRDLGVHYFEPPEVQYGMVTNYGGVRNWLLHSGAKLDGMAIAARSALYNLRLLATDPQVNGYHKMRILRALRLLKYRNRHAQRSASGGSGDD
jgi:FkbM family methyltransferase